MFGYTPRTVSNAKELTSVSICHSQGNDFNTVIMRVSAPGCDRFLNHAVLAFFSHPGAITPMGAITPIPVRKHN